jgi:1-deoxy-D-xylulose-5-phosphate synthase
VPLDTKLRQLPIGEGEVLRHGNNVAIIALGAAVAPALEAARELESRGIAAAVANARFAKPLDAALITRLASGIKKIVTVEENVLTGGFGSSVARLLQESGHCDVQVKSLGLPDIFVEHGSQAGLRSKYGLDASGIIKEVLALFPQAPHDLPLHVENKAGKA